MGRYREGTLLRGLYKPRIYTYIYIYIHIQIYRSLSIYICIQPHRPYKPFCEAYTWRKLCVSLKATTMRHSDRGLPWSMRATISSLDRPT